jgi:dynein light chain 1
LTARVSPPLRSAAPALLAARLADSLEILSLARNQLKKIENLDAVAGTLKQLWISYNNLVGLNGIEKLQNLEVLYMSNNKVHDIKEVERLQMLPKLTDFLFHGNTFHTRYLQDGNDEKEYRLEILKR